MVHQQANIIVVIVIGSLIMFLLTLVIVVFVVTYSKRLREKENRYQLSIKNKELELLRGVIDAQDAEREKIAASLHDEVGPLLTVLKLNITKHTRALDKQALSVDDLLEERKFIDSIIENIRNVSHELTPHFIKNNGLTYGLRNLVSSISKPEIQIHSEIDDKTLLNTNLTINCYRIILELLNNIMKHDQSEEIHVYLSHDAQHFRILITHNGNGLDQEEYLQILNKGKQSGLGLSSIHSRLLVHNAIICYSKVPTPIIELLFPLKHEQEN